MRWIQERHLRVADIELENLIGSHQSFGHRADRLTRWPVIDVWLPAVDQGELRCCNRFRDSCGGLLSSQLPQLDLPARDPLRAAVTLGNGRPSAPRMERWPADSAARTLSSPSCPFEALVRLTVAS